MKKGFFLFCMTCLCAVSALAQFDSFMAADSARKAGDVKKLIEIYRHDLSQYPKSGMVSFFLAQSYALDRQTDSAFKYLQLQLELDSNGMAPSDDAFLYLRTDKRWKEIEDKIIRYNEIRNPGGLKDIPLTKKLWELMALDQQYYFEIGIADHKLGANNPVSRALWDVKAKTNARNAATLDSIIAVKGWPKISQVGYIASMGAFLIVQHADLERQKKYLPVIKKLCEEKEIQCSNYALMYDRIQVSENKPQRYGSQLTTNEKTGKLEFSPIEDEKNVDKRRVEVGLGPLSEYAKQFGLEYVPK